MAKKKFELRSIAAGHQNWANTLEIVLDAETINKSNEWSRKAREDDEGKMKVCQRQPQSKRRFRALAWRLSSVLVELFEEEKLKLIIIGFGHKLTIMLVFSTVKPVEFRVQISRLQIGAATVIRAIAFIVTGSAQSAHHQHNCQLLYTFRAFLGFLLSFFDGFCPKKNLSINFLINGISSHDAKLRWRVIDSKIKPR